MRLLVSLNSLFEAGPPKATSSEYRRGYEKIFGKRAQARREKEQKEREKERQEKVRKEKKEVAKRHKTQKKRNDKRKQAKVDSIKKLELARKARNAERRAALKKKKLPPKPSGLDQIPAQIAHCMMAVHKKRKKSKEAAWNICRWAMTKYGYLKGPYRRNTKLPKAVKQTPKGVRRSFQHGMEKHPLNGGLPGTGITKYYKFKKMFKDMENDFVLKKER